MSIASVPETNWVSAEASWRRRLLLALRKARTETLAFLASLVLRAVNATLRWELVAPEGEEGWVEREPRIVTFWHGRQLMMPWYYLRARRGRESKPIFALISESHDGRLIASAMRHLGIGSVAGSSTRGGRKGAHHLLHKLKEDCHVAITPDGPRGPCYKVKEGVVLIARLSGRSICPVSVAADRYWQFPSWDKMVLPKPFARAVFVVGAPIFLAEHETGPQQAAAIERALNDVTERAERHFGC